jgi:hypothetical protein
MPAANEMQSVRINADGLASGSYIVWLTGEGFAAYETVALLRYVEFADLGSRN